MTRYSARLRQLEHRLAPSCPLCAGRAIDFITIHGDETLPPRAPCESCGKPRMAFVVHLADEQPDTAAGDIMPAPESRSKPLVRRRRFYGTE